MLRVLLELLLEDPRGLEPRGVGLVALQLRAGEVDRVEDLRLVVLRVLRGERLVRLGARELPLALAAAREILVVGRDGLEIVALALGLRAHLAALVDRPLRRLGVLRRSARAGERVVHQDGREAPGGNRATRVLLRHFLERPPRRAVVERVQHRDRALQLLLHGRTAGIGEIDLAQTRHAVRVRGADQQQGKRQRSNTCHANFLPSRGRQLTHSALPGSTKQRLKPGSQTSGSPRSCRGSPGIHDRA